MKVVVATDRSETAQRAVAWAAQLAQRFGGELVLLNVHPKDEDLAEELLRANAVTLLEHGEWFLAQERGGEIEHLLAEAARARVGA